MTQTQAGKAGEQAFRAVLDPYLDGSADATHLLGLLRSDDLAHSYVPSVIATKKEQLAASCSPEKALQSWRKLDMLVSQWMHGWVPARHWVLATSTHGYAATDENYQIVDANQVFCQLVPACIGLDLLSIFAPSDRDLVRKSLRAPRRTQLLQIEVNTARGTLPMSIEIGALPSTGGEAGGYILIADMTNFLAIERRLLEASQIGILRVTRIPRRIRYANGSAAKLLGVAAADLEGRDPFDLVSGESKSVLREATSTLDREQRSIEREVDYVRPNGSTIPVHVTLYPEFNELDERTGALVELRADAERRASRAIYEAAAGQHSSAESLFHLVVAALRKVVPFDFISLNSYSADGKFTRMLYSDPVPPVQTVRWWPLKGWADWVRQGGPPIADLASALKDPRTSPEVLNRPDTQWFIKQGYNSWLPFPLIQEDRLQAALLLSSLTPNTYTDEHREILNRIGGHRVLEALLRVLERERTQFLLDLSKSLQSANNSRGAAQILVDGLVRFHQWPNVTIFKINRIRHRFELLAHARGPGGRRISTRFRQDLSEGVLGEALRTGRPQILYDTEDTTEKLARKFRGNRKKTHSELAYPIHFKGRVVWILNLEDSVANGFTRETERELASIIGSVADRNRRGELQRTLERLFERLIQKCVLEAATQGIVVVRRPGGVQMWNRKAEKLLAADDTGMDRPASMRRRLRLKGRNIAAFAADDASAELLRSSRTETNQQIVLGRANGTVRRTLASSTHLGEEYDHQVFFFQDVAELEWETDKRIIREILTTLAAETRRPLSLTISLLRRLKDALSESEVNDLLDRALGQLGKVSMVYQRIEEGVARKHQRMLTVTPLDQIVRDQIARVPPQEREQVDTHGLQHVVVNGDEQGLQFAVGSILQYLLRRCSGQGRVVVTTRKDDATGVLMLDGPYVPAAAPSDPMSAAATRARDLLELAPKRIKEIVEVAHGGTLQIGQGDGRAFYEIKLPLAGASDHSVARAHT